MINPLNCHYEVYSALLVGMVLDEMVCVMMMQLL
jgi:hypothetical protein